MTVVCAIDGSRTSHFVATYGAEVAARAGERLVLVRAVQVGDVGDPSFLPVTPYRTVADPLEQRERVLERAGRQLEELRAQLSGTEVETEVRSDMPADAVLAAAGEHQARAIVVGTRGATGLLGAVGSVSRRIMRRAQCPVLTVPREGAPALSRSPVLLAGIRGGDPRDAGTAARRAAELAGWLRAELVLAHVRRSTDGDGAEAGAASGLAAAGGTATATAAPAETTDWIEDPPPGARLVTTRGTPAQELMRLAVEMEADALVVAPRGHGPVRQALLGSVSSGLLAAGERPVFVIPRAHVG